MIKKLALAFGLLWLSVLGASAQTCPTRPTNDSSNACASTAFVHNVAATQKQGQIRFVRVAANTWQLFDNNNNIIDISTSHSQGYQEFLNLVASSGYGGSIESGEQIASGDTGTITTTLPIAWPPLQGVTITSGWFTLNCSVAVTGDCETYDTLVQVDLNIPHQVIYAGTTFPVRFNPVNNSPLDGIPGILNSTIRLGPTAPATGASYTGGVRMTPTNNIIGSSIRFDQIACLGPPASPCSASEGFQLDNPGGIIQVRNNTIGGVINQANVKGVRIGTSSTGMTAVFDNTFDFHVAMPVGSLSSSYCLETWAVNNRYTGSCYSDGSGLLLGSSSDNQDFSGFVNTATTRLADNSITHNNPGAYGPLYINRTIAFSASRTLTQADSFGVLDSGGASGTVVATLTAANYGTGFTTCAVTTGGHAITYTAATGVVFYPGGSSSSITVAINETACLRFDGTNYEVTDASPALQFALGYGGTVAVGGTGQSSLTNHGLIVGAGTSPVSVTAVGTTGQYLCGSTGADPTWCTLSSSAVTSFSAGTTGLTPSTPTAGAIVLAGTLAVANGGTGITSFGTGVAAALGNNTNASGGLITFSGALGSPTATQITIGGGTAITSSGAGGTAITSGGGTVSGALTISSTSLIESGNISAASWTVSGIRNKFAAASFTDTSSSGTVANAYTDLFGASTILASSATTYTNYFGAYFQAPVPSTNVTMTNKYALGADSLNVAGQIISTSSARQISVGAATGEKLASNAGFDAEGFGNTQNAGVERLAGAYNTSTHQGQLGAFGASTSTSLAFMTANAGTPANALVLDSSSNATFSGQVLVTAMTQTAAAQSGTVCYNSGTGAITYDATLGCLASSERYKDVVGEIEPAYALDIVNRLAPVFFTFKSEHATGRDGEFYGLIAEQVATIDERLISRDAEGKPRGVRYADGISAMNTAAIQALSTKLDKIAADNDNIRDCLQSWQCRAFGIR